MTNAVLQARDQAVKAERFHMQKLLDEALRLGEANVHENIKLKLAIEKALAHLKRKRFEKAVDVLKQAVSM